MNIELPIKNRTCRECGGIFPASNFYCSTLKATGKQIYTSACKPCYKMRMRRWDAKIRAKNGGISRSVLCRSKSLSVYAAHIIQQARARSRKRGIEFRIDVAWFLSALDNQNWECAISGVKMAASAGTGKRLYNGVSIDRIDNSLGYTPENCWLVCYSINAFKSDTTLENVIMMCRSVADKWPE